MCSANCLQTGKPAFDKIHGISFFDYACQHPEPSLLFDEMLTSLTGWEAQLVANAFDFSPFHTLVDVAGGQGRLLTTILKANSQIHGVLFDLPSVVEGARRHIEGEGLMHRCDVIAGDFFTLFHREVMGTFSSTLFTTGMKRAS